MANYKNSKQVIRSQDPLQTEFGSKNQKVLIDKSDQNEYSNFLQLRIPRYIKPDGLNKSVKKDCLVFNNKGNKQLNCRIPLRHKDIIPQIFSPRLNFIKEVRPKFFQPITPQLKIGKSLTPRASNHNPQILIKQQKDLREKINAFKIKPVSNKLSSIRSSCEFPPLLNQLDFNLNKLSFDSAQVKSHRILCKTPVIQDFKQTAYFRDLQSWQNLYGEVRDLKASLQAILHQLHINYTTLNSDTKDIQEIADSIDLHNSQLSQWQDELFLRVISFNDVDQVPIELRRDFYKSLEPKSFISKLVNQIKQYQRKYQKEYTSNKEVPLLSTSTNLQELSDSTIRIIQNIQKKLKDERQLLGDSYDNRRFRFFGVLLISCFFSTLNWGVIDEMRYQLIKSQNVDLGYRLYYFLSILLMFPLKFIIKKAGIRTASQVSSILLILSNVSGYLCWYYENKLLVAISEFLLFSGGPYYLILEFIQNYKEERKTSMMLATTSFTFLGYGIGSLIPLSLSSGKSFIGLICIWAIMAIVPFFFKYFSFITPNQTAPVKQRSILVYGLVVLTVVEFLALNESSIPDSFNWTYYKYCSYLAAFCFLSALICIVIAGIQARVDDIRSLIPLKIVTLVCLIILCIDDSLYTTVWMTLVYLPCAAASTAITFSALSKMSDSWMLPMFTAYMVAIVDIIEVFNYQGFKIISIVVSCLLGISCVADFWLLLPFKQ